MQNAATIIASPQNLRARLARFGGRYALSLAGTVSVSVAHFGASILIFHALPAGGFGLFSFVIVAVAFCLSMSGSMLGAPATIAAARRAGGVWPEREMLFSASLIFAGLAGAAMAGLLLAAGAIALSAALFGLYASVMCLRFFARTYGYIENMPLRVTLSDLIYSAVLLAALTALVFLPHLAMPDVAAAMLLAALAGLLAAPPEFLRLQLRARPSLAGYAPVWREMSRFSLLGVISTEFSANAHAYIVTLIAGPKAFALIALGGLFMRPIGLALTALSDAERAPLARHVAARDGVRARRAVADFEWIALLMWLGTALLAAALLFAAPKLVLKDGFALRDVATVTLVWTAIMAVRVWRTGQSLLLQAAKEFAPLANASVMSSAVSLSLVLALLLAFGPVVSLIGLLIGDVALAGRIFLLSRRLRF